MTALEKELVEALEAFIQDENWQRNEGRRLNFPTEAYLKAEALLARAKQSGTHEFTVTDDGHGRAMVGARRLAYGGQGIMSGATVPLNGGQLVCLGTRVRVELRDGCDFATLVEVLP